MVTILDSPNNKDCWTCKAIKSKLTQPLQAAFYADIFDESFNVETIIRYCPRCGKELLSELEYRENWVRYHKDDQRLFVIDGEIATPELIFAMINSKKKHNEELINEIKERVSK